MEQIIIARKKNYEKVLLEMTEFETEILQLEMKSELDEEEENQLKEAKLRLESLIELKERALAAVEELVSADSDHVLRPAAQGSSSFEQELRKLAQQENVLKGMLTRKPAKLSFNSMKDSALGFIEEFGKFAMRECPTPSLMANFMILLLSACTKDDPLANSFYESFLVEGTPTTLEDLKKHFMIFYKGKEYLGSQLPRLASVAMGKEKPGDYCSRLSMICTGSGLDLTQKSESNQIYIETWFANLPQQEQNNIQAEFSKMPRDAAVQDYLNLIIRTVPQQPGHIRKYEMFCPYCSGHVNWDCNACPTGQMFNRKEKHFKRPANEIVENDKKKFRKNDQNQESDKKKPPVKKTEDEIKKLKIEGKCFKCGHPWTPKGHKCSNDPIITVAIVDHNEMDIDYWNDQLEEAAAMSVEEKMNNEVLIGMVDSDRLLLGFDHFRPKVDLVLNGVCVKGLNLDTGADLSLITVTTLNEVFGSEEWKSCVSKMEQTLRTASADLVEPFGSIDLAVQRTEGAKLFHHSFVVVNKLPMHVQALIGLDLQRKLGFRLVEDEPVTFWVAGEPAMGESVELLRNVLEHLRDGNKNDSFYLKFIDDYRHHLGQRIVPLKDINEKLIGFCTFPGAEIEFRTTDEEPVVVQQYSIAYIHHAVIDKQISSWLQSGVIGYEKAIDHSNNPILVVPKRDITGRIKDWRVCIDPRMLNRKIRDSTHRLPRIDDIFQRLAGKKVFSIVDLKSGFNQIMVAEKDRKKTAFTWKQRVYSFNGAPFGAKNIPQDFQRIMDRVFYDLDYVIPYIDDIIVFSHSYEQHLKHVEEVLKRLNQYNLKVNWNKCQFACESLIILGHEISQEGIRVVQEKLTKMDSWTRPTTIRALQRMLGFLNYFRNFIPHYAKIMAPIEALRSGIKAKSNEKIVWVQEHQDILNKVREILESKLLLKYPDFIKPMFVATDASQYGLGAVLYQLETDGTRSYIKFASRSLSSSERNYGAPQRELLGVLFALSKFHDFIYGRKFTLYTDHQSLTYLLTKVNLAPSLRNWIGEILEYDFEIVHLPGLENHLPDALSRLYEPSDIEHDKAVGLVMATVVDGAFELIEPSIVKGLGPGIFNEDLDQLEIVNDLLKRNEIMEKAHDGFHEGAAGMARKIRSSFHTTWANLEKDCQEFVKKCINCQRYNVGRHGYSPPRSMLALYPFDHICIDLKEMPLSDQGNNYYLLVIDVATRFIFLRALKDKTAYSVAQALFVIFSDVGFPKMIQSDNGTEFVNEVMTSVKLLANVMERLIAPYSHKSNGMAERAIRTTSMAVWKTVEGRVTNWDRILPVIQFNFNNRVMEVHGSTPYSLVFARRANEFFDYSNLDLVPEEKVEREQRLLFLNSVVFPEIKEKVKRHVRKRNDYFVKTHRISKADYVNGSYVMMKTYDKGPKYKASYEGPLKIIGREASGAYRLQSLDGTEYVRSPDYLKMVVPDIIKDLKIADTVYAAVSKILEHRDLDDGTRLYRVRWVNQTANHDSWLKEADFNDLGPIQDYEKKLAKEKIPNANCKTKSVNSSTKNDVLDSQGLLKESITVQDFLKPTTDGKELLKTQTEQIRQETLLSEQQRKAWGPQQFLKQPKRLHKPAIVEIDSDLE